ncbi:MAG: dephospho-CoA kinase [Pseudobdellovibrionaceae bacterium]
MKWIGLTGGIASGKSSVSEILRSDGYPVVDADAIARTVVEPGKPGLLKVVEAFGHEVLKPDGSLDRKKLGQMVFAKPDQLLKLEKILHPMIQQETAYQRKIFADQGHAFAFYDVPLLFEKNLEKSFDAIIVVTSSEDLQRARMKKRDLLSEEEISHRLKSQIPLSLKVGKATWVLKNEGTLAELKQAVRELLGKIQSGKA